MLASFLLWIWDGPYTDFILLLWILVLSVSIRRVIFLSAFLFLGLNVVN